MKSNMLIICILLVAVVHAQKKAVTETGDEVVLYDNGTWKYTNETNSVDTIRINPTVIYKNKTASFLVKSTRCPKMGIWIDPKKWKFEKGKADSDAEFNIQLQGQDLYGMFISEKIEIPLESLQEIAISNAKNVAPDLIVVNKEYRTVNGLKVLFIQMDGTMKGVKATYYGYYYSGAFGSIQFVTYTAQSLLKNYIKDCDELLAGFTAIQ